MAPIQYHASRACRCRCNRLDDGLDHRTAALIKGLPPAGAKVWGHRPGNPDFNTPTLPMLMAIDDLPARYRKHFLGN